jgi:signal transduction histidine kinase
VIPTKPIEVYKGNPGEGNGVCPEGWIVGIYASRRLLVSAALFAVLTGWFALAGTWHHHREAAVMAAVVTAAVLAAGAGLQHGRRATKVGASMLVAGALWPGCWAGIGQLGIGPLCAWADENVIWVVLGTGLLSYPDQQPHSRLERRFLAALWTFVLAGLVLLPLISRPEWLGLPADAWWPDIHASRAWFMAALPLFAAGRFVFGVVGALLLVMRLRGASGLDRSLLAPTVAGILTLALVVNVTGVLQAELTSETAQVGALVAQGIALLLLPALVLVSAIRTRLARAEMIELLVRREGPPDAAFVQSALRTALHDDSVELLFWVPEYDAYADPMGRLASEPRPGHRYNAPLVGSHGQQLGVMTGDLRLREHEPLVEAAINAAAIELEIVALTMDLSTHMEQLRASRDRVVAAGEAERRRLARDLHDGVQQRMLAIALRLEHVHNQAREREVQHSLERIKGEVKQALSEIRDLAHGIRPSLLVHAGLLPALRAVTDGMPMPVEVDVPSDRYPQHAESTAYFVANEALSNVIKHSRASHVGVRVHRSEDQLWVEVTDDGVGGPDLENGSGLRGLADRVEAEGGDLAVTGVPNQGTRVVARIPCG